MSLTQHQIPSKVIASLANYPPHMDDSAWPLVFFFGKHMTPILKIALATLDHTNKMEVDDAVDRAIEIWSQTFDETLTTYRLGQLQDITRIAYFEDQLVRITGGLKFGPEEREQYRGRLWGPELEDSMADFATSPLPKSSSATWIPEVCLDNLEAVVVEHARDKFDQICEDMIFIDMAPPQNPYSDWWAIQPATDSLEEACVLAISSVPYDSMHSYIEHVIRAWESVLNRS